MAAQNKQTHFFHGTNKFPWKTQRTVHLLRIIFNFPFCPVPIMYSTEIFSKFFHLPPPICIQLPFSPYRADAWSLLSIEQTPPSRTLSKLYACFIICEGQWVIQPVLWWIWCGLLVWCLLALTRNTCTSPPPLSLAGWSISWLNGPADVHRPVRESVAILRAASAALPRGFTRRAKDDNTFEFIFH